MSPIAHASDSTFSRNVENEVDWNLPLTYKYEEGWLVVVDFDPDLRQCLADCGFSNGFTALLTACHDGGIEYLKFDADGPVYADVPQYLSAHH